MTSLLETVNNSIETQGLIKPCYKSHCGLCNHIWTFRPQTTKPHHEGFFAAGERADEERRLLSVHFNGLNRPQ